MSTSCILVAVSLPICAFGKTLKIAIVDTGVNFDRTQDVIFCKGESRDFTKTGLNDTRGHGTLVTNLIADQLKELDYCIVMIKWFDNMYATDEAYINSLKYAISLKPDIINLSLGGIERSEYSYEDEKLQINTLVKSNVIVIAAAGNDGKDLDKDCNYYPACINKKIVIVGNLDQDGKRYYNSNYGKIVKMWEIGTNIKSHGMVNTGTSMSCGVATGRIAKQILIKRKRK